MVLEVQQLVTKFTIFFSVTFLETGVIHDTLNDLRKECWVVIVEDEKSDTEILRNDT